VTLSARDKKLLTLLLPVVLLVAYWFVVLGPKRGEAGQLGETLAQEQTVRDDAVSEAERAQAAKSNYSEDLGAIIRVGKAIPSSVDMPGLIVQLDRAARGTGIHFERIKTGDRSPSETAASGSGGSAGTGGTPAATPGGASASTGSGQAAEKAGAAKQSSDSAAAGSDSAAGSTGEPGARREAGGSGVAGLDSVPLEFSFSGSFFDLADFFHRLKRFVHVTGDDVAVHGRLLHVDGVTFDAADFPTVRAEVTATVFLSPKSEGPTAGATPQGPAPGTGGQQTASTTSPPTQSPTAATGAR
jgi:hypothetical protein